MISLLLLSVFSGILTGLAFQPIGLDWLAWISLIPFFAALQQDIKLKTGSLIGLTWGLAFFGTDLRWIYSTIVVHGHFDPFLGIVTFLSLILLLSIYPCFFGLLFHYFANLGLPILFAPFLWVAMEYARATLFTGFPWDLLGYSQATHLSLIQLVDITGIYGISFILVLVNVCIFQFISFVRKGDRFPASTCIFAAGIIIGALIYGNHAIQRQSRLMETCEKCSIGILQGNIAQEIKWDEKHREDTFATYEKLARDAVQNKASLVIWPETSVPVLIGSGDKDWNRPFTIAQRLGIPMLIGAPVGEMVKGEAQYYNSALLINGTQVIGKYDKIHLVPFGEYMPLSWLLPLGPGIAARDLDYTSGKAPVLFDSPPCPPFAALICYEAIFPELSRNSVLNGARLLVNITNDGWFGNSGAPYQHLAMSGVRAIENRVWLLRSANTGISAAFDPTGKLMASIPLQTEGFFVIKVGNPQSKISFYTRFGDVFAFLCLSLLLIAVIFSLFHRQNKNSLPVY